ncbi:hypothetical protein [Acinetobacter nosocomialis]|uniref:hypothetical protein n=1 Tax=Acinetobacter nosocomialis TaxID=106654 RepID=UPI0024DE0187|nr:hypothetical protein [Acinetobacter nosocomialis]
MEQEYKGNMKYPFQDHIVLNMEENIVNFPSSNLRKCQHIQVEIDSKALELICMKCKAKVNPVIWIKDTLKYWSRQQTQITEQKKQIKEDLDELKKRARTKCQHCQKMTAINLKNYKFSIIG